MLTTNVLAVHDFVPLVSTVLVERSDDLVEVGEFLHRLNASLAFRRGIVIIGTLEDETDALRQESDLVGFTPNQKIQGNLTGAVMLGHAVHARFPPVFGCLQTVVSLESLQGFLFVLRVLFRGLGCSSAGFPRLPIALTELHVGKTNCIIEIEMSSEIPAAVIGVVATDVVGMDGEKCLVWRHTRGTRVQHSHHVIIHVSHAVSLETELVHQIQEDILELLLRERDLGVRCPRRVRLTRTLAGGKSVAVVHSVDRSRSTRRSVSSVGDLGRRRTVATTTGPSVLTVRVAVVPFVSTAIVVHVRSTSSLGPHREIAEGLRILLRIMATTAAWLALSLVVVLIAPGSGGAVVLILVSGLVISSVSVTVAGIRVGGVGAVATIRSVVAITVLAVSPSITQIFLSWIIIPLVVITITVSLVVVITLGMFVLVVGVTMRLTMCLPLLGIAIVIVASACVARHDERVAIDLVLRALRMGSAPDVRDL